MSENEIQPDDLGNITISFGDEDGKETNTEDGLQAERQPEEVSEPEVEPKEPADGYDLVDFGDLPAELRPKFEARFKRLYGQLKGLQGESYETAKQLRQMQDKLANTEAARHETESAAAKQDLLSRIVNAQNRADFRTAAELQSELTTLETRRTTQTQPVQQPVQEEDGKAKILNFLSSRPEIARNQGLQGWAIKRGQALAEINPDKSVDEVLQMVDSEIMKMTAPKETPKPNNTPRTVLSGNNTRPSGNRITLSPIEQRIAEKMWPDLDRGAAHKSYAEGKKMVSGS